MFVLLSWGGMEKEVSFYVLFALTYFFLLSMIEEFERPSIYIYNL